MIFWLLLPGLLVFQGLIAQTGSPDPRDILRNMNRLYRADSSQVIIEMEIITPHWSRTLKIESGPWFGAAPM